MAKKLDLNKTVYELTKEYPELIDIMAGLGFTEVTKKSMLNSVGRIMTIPKGAKMKNISMMDIVIALTGHDFEITGEVPGLFPKGEPENKNKVSEEPSESRKEQLKSYLKRLGAGESLDNVRADFVREFGEVEASEIMEAEQDLLNEGAPLSEVQKLCDIHSALFHGATAEEKIANAEKEVEASLLRRQAQEVPGAKPETKAAEAQAQGAQATAGKTEVSGGNAADKNVRAAELESIQGHPLRVLTEENNALTALLKKFREARDESLIPAIRGVSVHYAKKGDLLYPLLKVRYGVTGPSEVMWTVDDEIRDELNTLAGQKEHGEAWNTRLDAVLTRAEEMIYKEQNILFPICAVKFTEEEWHSIYRDAKDYAVCFGVGQEKWEDAENQNAAEVSAPEGEIVMPGGHFTLEQLTALLNTIPMEISFVDTDNINRFFNEGPKAFKRPGLAIDREVFSCHPPKVEPMVRKIIDDFRNNRRDEVPVWMEKGGRTMLVRYMAVRDRAGKYLGTVELVQDMEFAREHFFDESQA